MSHVLRPNTTGDGAPGRNDEIEITPEMIAAGVEACSFWDIGDPDEWKAVDIYRQMERARRDYGNRGGSTGDGTKCRHPSNN